MHYDGLYWKTITEREGLESNHFSCLLRSQDGTVWTAYGGRGRGGKPRERPGMRGNSVDGVSRFDPVDKNWVRFSEFDNQAGRNIMSMTEARDGSVWLGLHNGGVSRFKDGNWQRFTSGQGLPSDRVHCLAVSQEGAIWIDTPAGAARYPWAIGAEDWQVFTERDGLPSNFITSILSAQDGSVSVGTLRGTARYGAPGIRRCPQVTVGTGRLACDLA